MQDILLRTGIPLAWLDALHLDLLARLLLAAVLGGVIGLERELSGKPAGLRTNLLICVGAALLVEISMGVAETANLQNERAGAVFRADPSRIAAQIVSGIGFLGAGTILQSRGNVIGLTTAATLWVVAAIGMAVGSRAYAEALGSTVLVMFSLVLLGRLEAMVFDRRNAHRYILVLDPDPDLVRAAEDAFREHGLRVQTESIEKGDQFQVHFEVVGGAQRHARAMHALVARSGIHRLTRVD